MRSFRRQTGGSCSPSGSTLLAAILRQNPAIHAGMSRPIAPLFEGVLAHCSAGSEISTMVSTAQRAAILKGLFESYYAEFPQPLIIDTNRAWTAQITALLAPFPEAKLICTVRDVAWVLDSLERQYRANAFENTRLFNSPAERATEYTRLDALASANRRISRSIPAWPSGTVSTTARPSASSRKNQQLSNSDHAYCLEAVAAFMPRSFSCRPMRSLRCNCWPIEKMRTEPVLRGKQP